MTLKQKKNHEENRYQDADSKIGKISRQVRIEEEMGGDTDKWLLPEL